jgi:hypothetical protein
VQGSGVGCARGLRGRRGVCSVDAMMWLEWSCVRVCWSIGRV